MMIHRFLENVLLLVHEFINLNIEKQMKDEIIHAKLLFHQNHYFQCHSFLLITIKPVVFDSPFKIASNVRCKSSETNVEIACDLTEHGRNSIVFLSDRAESLD